MDGVCLVKDTKHWFSGSRHPHMSFGRESQLSLSQPRFIHKSTISFGRAGCLCTLCVYERWLFILRLEMCRGVKS